MCHKKQARRSIRTIKFESNKVWVYGISKLNHFFSWFKIVFLPWAINVYVVYPSACLHLLPSPTPCQKATRDWNFSGWWRYCCYQFCFERGNIPSALVCEGGVLSRVLVGSKILLLLMLNSPSPRANQPSGDGVDWSVYPGWSEGGEGGGGGVIARRTSTLQEVYG